MLRSVTVISTAAVVDLVGGAQQARAEDLLDLAELLAGRRRDVVAGGGIEALAGDDLPQLLALGVVGVEADVLLELEALLLDEGERLVGLLRERDLVAVDDRREALAHDEHVVLVRVDGRHRRQPTVRLRPGGGTGQTRSP